MVKNGQTKRRAKRARTARKGRRSVARMTAAPPMLNFNKQLMNTVIRGSKVVAFKSGDLVRHQFTFKTILEAYPQLPAVFSQFKIQRVKVWAYTTVSTSSAGIGTLMTVPIKEAEAKYSYEQLTATPGAITRRIWQPFHTCYYPTSPSEREWFGNGVSRQLFEVLFCAKDVPPPDATTWSTELQIIWDAHIRCRGLNTQTTVEDHALQEVIASYEVMHAN